jgi:hypothetical protein
MPGRRSQGDEPDLAVAGFGEDARCGCPVTADVPRRVGEPRWLKLGGKMTSLAFAIQLEPTEAGSLSALMHSSASTTCSDADCQFQEALGVAASSRLRFHATSGQVAPWRFGTGTGCSTGPHSDATVRLEALFMLSITDRRSLAPRLAPLPGFSPRAPLDDLSRSCRNEFPVVLSFLPQRRLRRVWRRMASTLAAKAMGVRMGVPRQGDIDSRSVSLETMSMAPTSAARSRTRLSS